MQSEINNLNAILENMLGAESGREKNLQHFTRWKQKRTRWFSPSSSG